MSDQWGSNMDNGTRRALAVITETVAGAFLGGIVTGAALSGAGEGFGDVVSAIFAAALAFLLAASGGVTYVGRSVFKQPGSFWLALAGAVAGAVLTLILAPLGLANNSTLLMITFIALSAIFSALAFTWSAKRHEKAL